MTRQERDQATSHEKIFTAKATPFYEDELEAVIVQLVRAALHSDGGAVRRLLGAFIPEYRPLPPRADAAKTLVMSTKE